MLPFTPRRRSSMRPLPRGPSEIATMSESVGLAVALPEFRDLPGQIGHAVASLATDLRLDSYAHGYKTFPSGI